MSVADLYLGSSTFAFDMMDSMSRYLLFYCSCTQVYDEYCPILLTQCNSREYDKFETFDDALDEFYSKIESQRVNQQHKAKEDSAVHRLNKIKLDQVPPPHSPMHACNQVHNLLEFDFYLEDLISF